MVSRKTTVALISLFAARAVVVCTVVLSPENVDILENSSVTFTCSINSSKTINESQWWKKSSPSLVSYIAQLDGKCVSAGFITQEDKYTAHCNENNAFSLTIKDANRSEHLEEWNCMMSEKLSNPSTILIKVPVKAVDMILPEQTVITTKENSRTRFQCQTSPSRPKPTIFWFLSSNYSRIVVNISNEVNQMQPNGYQDVITDYKGVLDYHFNRTYNGWHILCTAANMPDQNVTSTYKELNILYSPDKGPTIYGLVNGSTYTIEDNDLGNLSCSITWGNPLPLLSWNCSGNTFPSTIDKKAVGLNLQWTTERDKDEICVCSSTHSSAGIQIALVRIIVLYPPGIPKISVSTHKGDKLTVNETINITETESINLECFSKGKPKPSFTWFVNKTHISDRNVLKLANITRRDAGHYTCYVNNLMNTTFGSAVPGNNSSRMPLNILYPADIESLKKTSLTEASTLKITCPVIPGNPSTTVIFWTRESDDRRWNSSQLIIFNVTRADDTFYTCTVLSEMVSTVGNVTKSVRSSNFHLNVFYSAAIKTFSFIGEEAKEYFVVNETEKVSTICTVEANPASDITIVSPKHEHIITQSHTNHVSHTLLNTSYENAGVYICTGRNNYTIGEESSSKLTLIVRCPPRPSSESTNSETIATSLNVEVKLMFTARNYLDVPDKTTFTWFKENVSIESDNRTFGISSNGLESNLSIKNITEAEFGQYEMRVSNSVGQYIHVYKVMAKASVKPPLESHSSSMVGVVAGSVSSCVVIAAVIIAVAWVFTKRLNQTNEQIDSTETGPADQTESSFTYDELDVSKREEDTYSQLPAAYEQLDIITKKGNIYMEMKNTNVKREDPDYINIRI